MTTGSRLRPFVLLTWLTASWACAQVPGWDPRWPSVDAMLKGHDPAFLRESRERSAQIARNPNDVAALNRRGYVCSELSRSGLYRVFWRWLAAKDLEQVVKLDPNNFYAWHNYGDLNYMSGDFWMMNDHSNAERAVRAFDRALAVNPRYVGTWTQGECRISMALYPGPDQPWEGQNK